jgi:hypothetical protein
MGVEECFTIITGNGTNTILLIPGNEGFDISEEILASASEIHRDALSRTELARMRVSLDDISRFDHVKKR